MASFEMIKYHGREYPADIPLRIEEIAAHFDITSVRGNLKKSLHTEYSYGKCKLNSALKHNYYPGQWKDSADDFIEKSNQKFTFS